MDWQVKRKQVTDHNGSWHAHIQGKQQSRSHQTGRNKRSAVLYMPCKENVNFSLTKISIFSKS